MNTKKAGLKPHKQNIPFYCIPIILPEKLVKFQALCRDAAMSVQ